MSASRKIPAFRRFKDIFGESERGDCFKLILIPEFEAGIFPPNAVELLKGL
jgi:hypothetical protein